MWSLVDVPFSLTELHAFEICTNLQTYAYSRGPMQVVDSVRWRHPARYGSPRLNRCSSEAVRPKPTKLRQTVQHGPADRRRPVVACSQRQVALWWR